MYAVEITTEVTIVGGGPVGVALAIDLGQRGVNVVVLEKEETLHRIPKGQNLTQRTMEHFRVWGVEDSVRAARIMPPGYPSAGVNAYGNLLSEFAQPWFRRSTVGQYYFAANERLPQYLTEEALRQRAHGMANVEVRYGEAVVDVEIDDSGATVTTEISVIRSKFVVGCDGAHSVVRGCLGIEEEISDHGRRMALLVFRSRQLFEILSERYGEAAFFNVLDPALDGYWRFLGMVDVGESWFFHAPVPADSTVETLDHEALLHESVGARFEVDLEYVGFWDLRVGIANSYRSGRGFLAGDAAHSHPPYGGYGINTGFDDARNLGWKLAAQIEGWAGERLLDSYTEERRPVFASTASDFIERFIDRDRRFIAAHDPEVDRKAFVEAWEARSRGGLGVSDYVPHYAGSPIVSDDGDSTPGAVGAHDFVARPGHHLPPPRQIDPAEFFRQLGPGFTLVCVSNRAETASRFEEAANASRVPLETVFMSESMGDYQTDMILVRPDHHVAWVDAGRDSPEPREVLDRARGA